MRPAAVLRYLLLLAALGGLAAHVSLFNFVTDDAYISFRYARNLAEHGELVFNLGERVEGYTNFLWTVTLAGVWKLGVGPEVSSRVLGVLLGLIGLIVTFRLGRDLTGRPSPWDAVAPLLLAATGAYAAWSMGGLETQMFTCLFTAGVWLYLREHLSSGGPRWSALLFGAAALTRPEGIFFFALTVLHRVVANRWRERRLLPTRGELLWVGLFLLIIVPHFAWRWTYYGWPFPNTFYIKSASGPATLDRGLFYLFRWVQDYALYLVPAILVLGWPRRDHRGHRALLGYAAFILPAFLAYVVRVGGDFMGLYRFLVPALPLTALVVQEGLRRLAQRVTPPVGRVVPLVATAAVVLLHAVSSYPVSVRSAQGTGAERGVDSIGYLKKFADDRALVGKWMASVAQPDDILTVGGAGAQPFYAQIPTVDAFGLTNEYIAHWVPAASDRPGHQKFACHDFMVRNRPCPGTKPGAPAPPPRPQPTMVCHTYRLGERAPYRPPRGDAAYWRRLGYEWVSARIPGLEPPYYSFLKRLDRALGPFPARVEPASQPREP